MTPATALKLQQQGDFSGGPMVKHMPCNTGDVGTIPGQGTKILYATTRESVCYNKRPYMMPQKCQLLQLRPDTNSKYFKKLQQQADPIFYIKKKNHLRLIGVIFIFS